MKNKFYITTPIYYINAKPHIGSAYTTIAADVLARYHRMIGDKTFFLTGTDEHGEKNEAIAKKEKIEPQEYADKMSAYFEMAWDSLNISNDGFIRTTDKDHKKAVQRALQNMHDKGYIYKGKYTGLYCSGCEQYKTEKDLVDGLCPDHKTKPVEMSEESYMFKMSAFSDQIKKAIEKDELLITPESKKNEILSFYKDGLNDISFSRTNTTWGVELPWDKKQVSYVWPDAFLNYLTGLGWDGGEKVQEMWEKDVEVVHLMSKDILRVHATIWPAMLLALSLPLPKRLFIHGFFLVEGQKMSKSIGNVIAPDELIKKYGVDATRYLLMDVTPFGNDGDVSWGKFDEKFNADLANGLGNLVSRVLTLTDKYLEGKVPEINKDDVGDMILGDLGVSFKKRIEASWVFYNNKMNGIQIEQPLANIKELIIGQCDKHITSIELWKLIKENKEEGERHIYALLETIRHIALMLWPFMPEISDRILEALGFDSSKEREKDIKELSKWGGLSEKAEVKKPETLFPRI